ncbi:MAG: hypothetical protein AAFP22_05310, partial [Planctomycetota bacterium]
MKLLRWLILAPAALALLTVVAVNVAAPPMLGAPAPDPTRSIALPDGSERALGELVDAALAELEAEPGAGAIGALTSPASPGEAAPEAAPLRPGLPLFERDRSDLILLAEYQLELGRPADAIALLRSVPPDHPQHAKALRRLGWDCYAKAMDAPGKGVAFVNA